MLNSPYKEGVINFWDMAEGMMDRARAAGAGAMKKAREVGDAAKEAVFGKDFKDAANKIDAEPVKARVKVGDAKNEKESGPETPLMAKLKEYEKFPVKIPSGTGEMIEARIDKIYASGKVVDVAWVDDDDSEHTMRLNSDEFLRFQGEDVPEEKREATVSGEEYRERSIVNGIVISVAFDTMYEDYTIYFPQIRMGGTEAREKGVSDQVIRISANPEIAKKVYDKAVELASATHNVYDLYKKVDDFMYPDSQSEPDNAERGARED